MYKRQGLNVSRVLCQLGDDVVATGLLGGHMGAYMGSLMDADGIYHDFTPIAGETRICLNKMCIRDRKKTRQTPKGMMSLKVWEILGGTCSGILLSLIHI